MPNPTIRYPIGSLAARLAAGEELLPLPTPDEPTSPPSNDGPQFFHGGPFRTESGSVIPDLTICYETWGRPAPGRSNAVILCHGRSGDTASWGAFIGAGKLFDPERHFIIAMDALGSGRSTRPSASGLGTDFPQYTIRDMVRAQCLMVTKGLGVTQVRSVAGVSMGAYMALEWALLYPPFVRTAVCVLPSAFATPQLRAVHEAVREAIALDPGWQGDRSTMPPHASLEAAALVEFPWGYGEEWYLQYRSDAAYEEKLAQVRQKAHNNNALDVWYQTVACDLHDVAMPYGLGLPGALDRFRSPVLLLPSSTDVLIPPSNAALLQELLPNAQLVDIPSYAGHAAGLLEVEFVSQAIQSFWEGR